MSTIWRPATHIRAIALGLVRRGDALLMSAVRDDHGTLKGWRSPGGGIELGERATEALRRELMEELGQAIAEPRLLAVMENIYQHHGVLGHEVAFVFEAAFADPAAYRREAFEYVDGGMPCEAVWIDVARLRARPTPLFPAGLIDHL
jgi:ADP-ribose pyrophosphatase YjhB (NUDIX family)